MTPYNFPGGIKPWQHQLETFDFIMNAPRCFVFDDIGTGKTLSTAWAMHHLIQQGHVRRVLLVAPLSTLDIVWKRTLFLVDPVLDARILKGSAAQKRAQYESIKRGVAIINPDSLHILIDAQCDPPDLLIVDESAMFRQQKARRAKALRAMCADITRIVMMTGSPTPEAPTDVWFTARIICPERMPRYFGNFRDEVMRKVSQWKWVAKPDAEKTIAEMLRGYVIRHKRSDCLDLPPTLTVTHEVATTKEVKDLLKKLKDEAAAQVEAGLIHAANEAVVRQKLLQVVSGAVKASNEEGRNNVLHKVDVKPKFDALRELLDASTQPVVIYSNFIGALAQISLWLREHSIAFRLVVGDTSPDNRVKAFDAVQKGEIRVLLAHPRAMAHGVTLTNSNIIVWWTPIDSHEIYEQATGRITRGGQTRKTYIVHFVSSWIERHVLKRQESKEAFQGVLLEYLSGNEL